MLGSTYEAMQPIRLKTLVVYSTSASIELYINASKILLKERPQDIQAILAECERVGNHDSEK